ncbi:MAG: hypothetical protein LBL24_00370 [Bacteroidales bacterium]|nr:hypothetical protein [Bacteroidales bacterium]
MEGESPATVGQSSIHLLRPNCEAVQPATGLQDSAVLRSTSCCASQGVIDIGCRPASDPQA